MDGIEGFYLVIRLRSKKLGEPRRLGIDGDRERDLDRDDAELPLLELRDDELFDDRLDAEDWLRDLDFELLLLLLEDE